VYGPFSLKQRNVPRQCRRRRSPDCAKITDAVKVSAVPAVRADPKGNGTQKKEHRIGAVLVRGGFFNRRAAGGFSRDAPQAAKN
jgi:hypothetical protein